MKSLQSFVVPFGAGRLVLVLSLAMCGCGTRDGESGKAGPSSCLPAIGASPSMYSGEFGVLSHYPKTILIDEWERFDAWCPSGGVIVPEAKAGTLFPRRKDYPESTVVVWKEEGAAEWRRQEIDLRGVVPPNVEGTALFELSKEGQWSVSFVPGPYTSF